MKTAKRLREEEDYYDDESMQYAIKKRKFLIERKLDEYDPPSYEEDEEHARTLSLPYKAPMNTLPYKSTNSKKCDENLILCFIVFLIVSGVNKNYLKMFTSLDFSFLLFRM